MELCCFELHRIVSCRPGVLCEYKVVLWIDRVRRVEKAEPQRVLMETVGGHIDPSVRPWNHRTRATSSVVESKFRARLSICKLWIGTQTGNQQTRLLCGENLVRCSSITQVPRLRVRTFAVEAWHGRMQFDRSRPNGITVYLSALQMPGSPPPPQRVLSR